MAVYTIDITKVGAGSPSTIDLNKFLGALESCQPENDLVQIEGIPYVLSSAAIGSGAIASAVWGAITGNITDQLDLIALFGTIGSDIIPCANYAAIVAINPGDATKLYVDISVTPSQAYRWNGSGYTPVGDGGMTATGAVGNFLKVAVVNGALVVSMVASAMREDVSKVSATIPILATRLIAGSDLDGTKALSIDGNSIFGGYTDFDEVVGRGVFWRYGNTYPSIVLADFGNNSKLKYRANTHEYRNNNDQLLFHTTLGGAYQEGAKLATETYVDARVVNLLVRQPAYNPNITALYPVAADCHVPANGIKAGFAFFISAAGMISADSDIELKSGDCLVAKINNPAQLDSDWDILDANINYVAEDSANKRSDLTSPDNTNYPTTLAVQNGLDEKMGLVLDINQQTATYVLVLSDANKLVEIDSTDPECIVAVPLNSSEAFEVGTVITIVQRGTGRVTIAPTTGGITILTKCNLVLSGQYAEGQLVKTGEDEWYFFQSKISSELSVVLSQGGTDAPVIVAIQNNTTPHYFQDIDFSYQAVGQYRLSKLAAFINFRKQSGVIDALEDYYYVVSKIDDDTILINTLSKSMNAGSFDTFEKDELLYETLITIKL